MLLSKLLLADVVVDDRSQPCRLQCHAMMAPWPAGISVNKDRLRTQRGLKSAAKPPAQSARVAALASILASKGGTGPGAWDSL